MKIQYSWVEKKSVEMRVVFFYEREILSVNKSIVMDKLKFHNLKSVTVMNNNNTKIKSSRIKPFLIPFISMTAVLVGSVSFPSSAFANWWAGSERSGSCYIPNRQKNFSCKFPTSGTYRVVNGARQIGGFYVNPRHQFGSSGDMPIEYRINQGGNWIPRTLKLNLTSANYIDFGNGVNSFEFRFLRPSSESLGGGTTTYFKFNYDLDR
jgi:hypothetical protein